MNNLVGYSSLNLGQHTFMMEVMDRHGLTATSQISFKCKSLMLYVAMLYDSKSHIRTYVCALYSMTLKVHIVKSQNA